MEPIKHEMRLSETVAPFGVGAIVDIRGESLIAPDTSEWDKKLSTEIHCRRLTDRLGSSTLIEAPTHSGPVTKGMKGLPYRRFPEWRFCERCNQLSNKTPKHKGKWVNSCSACNGALVPMRYVAICEGGSHLSDINWFTWAHRGHDKGVTEAVRHCRAYKELRFVRSATRGEGLGSLRVSCIACRRSRPLSDLVAPKALQRDGIKCTGRQPWQDQLYATDPTTACEHSLVAVQRGATGNYIAEKISALEIPEERPKSLTVRDDIRNHLYFEKLVSDNGGPQSQMIAEWVAAELGTTPEAVLEEASQNNEEDESVLLDLKDGEWAAFLTKLEQTGRDRSGGYFVVDSMQLEEDPGNRLIKNAIASIGQVQRVREVRALKGFQRHSPDAAFVSADLSLDARRHPYYPAIEMFGEGIFLRFDENHLAEWESHPAVRARADLLKERRDRTPWAARRLDVPEPRFLALHTVAHMLIRRLAYASGYSSAALQERIYASSDRPDRTAGILIYTAAGDAQGTLGGLVRLGQPDKLVPLLISALEDADYCSNDPVCIESDRQGTGSLNLSACHGCALISETSCEASNRLLDRQLVLGGRNVPGLLENVLSAARSNFAEH